MQAIFKRNILFHGPNGEKLVMKASPDLQAAPDWVANTEEFRLGLLEPKKGIQAIQLADAATGLVEDRARLLRENRQLQEQLAHLQAQIEEKSGGKHSAKKSS